MALRSVHFGQQVGLRHGALRGRNAAAGAPDPALWRNGCRPTWSTSTVRDCCPPRRWRAARRRCSSTRTAISFPGVGPQHCGNVAAAHGCARGRRPAGSWPSRGGRMRRDRAPVGDLQRRGGPAARFAARRCEPRAAVGCIGRIAPEKGQLEFLQAAALIHRGFPECRFLIYGAALFDEPGARDTTPRSRAAAAGLPVEFPGWVPDVYAALWRISTCCWCPRRHTRPPRA